MKYSKWTIIFVCFFLSYSCEKENNEKEITPQFQFIAGEVSSNINYVDFEPDRLLLPELNNSPSIFIDLFNDNSWDFKIVSSWEASHPGIWEDIYISNSYCNYFEVAIDTTLSELNYYGVFAKIFTKGDTLNSNEHNWINKERVFLNSTYNGNTIGPWINQKDKYIGIRNIIEQDTIYSWVRFSNSEENSNALICHDYAYVGLEKN